MPPTPTPRPAREDSDFPPQALRDYAFLADGERGALVGPRGEICWLCAPQWHDEAVFSTLIGGAGLYAVTPRGRFVPGGHYEDGSLIWRSRWITENGIVECREALAFPAEPGRVVLLRRVLAREGPAHLDVVLQPLAGYGSRPLHDAALDGDGVWTGRVGDLYMRWSGGAGARLREPADGGGEFGADFGAEFVLELSRPAGARHDLVLELGTAPPHGPPVDAQRAWTGTERAWSAAVPALDHTIADRDARFSWAVLRGMTSSGGGTVAAATTSLPERAEEGRNYDYRYVWIRDQCLTGQAVAAAGPHSRPRTRSSAARCPTCANCGSPAIPAGTTAWATPGAASSSSTSSARPCSSSPPQPNTTGSTTTDGGPPPSPRTPSPVAGANPTPGSGSWTSGSGRTAG